MRQLLILIPLALTTPAEALEAKIIGPQTGCKTLEERVKTITVDDKVYFERMMDKGECSFIDGIVFIENRAVLGHNTYHCVRNERARQCLWVWDLSLGR